MTKEEPSKITSAKLLDARSSAISDNCTSLSQLQLTVNTTRLSLKIKSKCLYMARSTIAAHQKPEYQPIFPYKETARKTDLRPEG